MKQPECVLVHSFLRFIRPSFGYIQVGGVAMRRTGRYPGGRVDPLTLLVVTVFSALSLTLMAQAEASQISQYAAVETASPLVAYARPEIANPAS